MLFARNLVSYAFAAAYAVVIIIAFVFITPILALKDYWEIKKYEKNSR